MDKSLDLHQISITDPFWGGRRELIKNTAIPYQWEVLNDRIEGVEKSSAIRNFRIAAGLEAGKHYGWVFQDSDLSKWIEGAAHSLVSFPDPELEKKIDEIADLLEMAQCDDGYLDTYFIIEAPERRWTNLYEGHEMYCAGHLIEAAAAYYDATGKTKLLDIARRFADCIYDRFGPGKEIGIPGHEEIEIGLMKLFRVTGDEKYAALARHFIDMRGTDPLIYAREREKTGWDYFGNMNPYDGRNTQSHLPVREQKEAVGHSVRAVYLYTAMADAAAHFHDESLADACETLWSNMTERRMYITGGIGSTPAGEGFTRDYDLPNDRGYSETCAAIGLIFFARKMLALKTDGKYADVMERALYNNVLGGMQLDGTRFFYVNPLEVEPGISGELFGYKHVLPERPGWYACACCPPNVVRLLMSLGQYAWGQDERTIYSHLFMGGSVSFDRVKIEVVSSYPWEGRIIYKINDVLNEGFSLAIHIPSHVKEFRILLNGSEFKAELKQGYIYIERKWSRGDVVEVLFDIQVRRVFADPMVRADEGCTALMRGPFVYAFEGVDNGPEIQKLRLPADSEIREIRADQNSVLKGMVILQMNGKRAEGSGALYSEERPQLEDARLTAIPYFAWGNRGLNQMKVWIQEV